MHAVHDEIRRLDVAEFNINSVNLLIIFLEFIQVRAGQQTTPLLEPTVLSRGTRYFSQHCSAWTNHS